ncbi:hypothetical protein HU200_013640 [Digitaria exilis]|uniref:F-box domain-containing protein n=1 Tax=Digitaria exilis TaxID=1010633 RepID=A0A835FDD4_9POAL|nr:hypothetical protein HU200_013640 [Digitaria exilis]
MEEAEAPPKLRSRRDAMPEDALYEILLRLPAEDLCRLRAVCRPWRSLLSDPHFIAAHAARHPDQPPLVVVGYQATDRNGRVLCDIVDLSGRVVKRVHAAAGDEDDDDSLGRTTKWVMSTQGDLVCVTRGTGMSCCQLLDPATGAVHDLPDGLAAEHSDHYSSDCWGSTVFGLVPSTGEYKVFRMIEGRYEYYNTTKLYEVLTLNGSGSPDEARWRKAQAPPYGLELLCHDNGVVINGIVYFLLKPDEWDDTRQGLVGSYDLEMEKWRPGIQEPLSCQYETWYDFKVTSLGGNLVLCCRKPSSSMVSPAMDIWFLSDFDKGLWTKQHSIKISVLHVPNLAPPLLVLTDSGDGSHNGNWAFLQNYNNPIDIVIDVLQRKDVEVGLYGGNLLSLANGTS